MTEKTLLLVASNPLKTDRLRLDEEIREIRSSLRRFPNQGGFQLEILSAPRRHDLRQAMLELRPSFVHFCGHGTHSQGSTGLIFETEAAGPQVVEESVLEDFFKLFSEHLHCVVLNACYTESQARAIARHVKYVVGMSAAIQDRASVAYARAFYEALAAGRTVEEAHDLSLVDMRWGELEEHSIPRLWCRVGSQEATSNSELPPFPTFFVGRATELNALKARLGIGTGGSPAPQTVIRGWPGVGKTSLLNRLAHDEQVQAAFEDGILWAPVGEEPDSAAILKRWARLLGFELHEESLQHTTARLGAFLRGRRTLILCDDIWSSEAAIPLLQICGPRCSAVVTTRSSEVARRLVDSPDSVFLLQPLDDEHGLEILERSVPGFVANHRDSAHRLVRDLEGLPLAIRVAGRLLAYEMSLGLDVTSLIEDLRASSRLLEAKAPADRFDPETGTTPTIRLLLAKSSDRLDAQTRERFSFLGAMAPKPAHFGLWLMAELWAVEEPEALETAKRLVDHGLLEPVAASKRFQMHAVLVQFAASILPDA